MDHPLVGGQVRRVRVARLAGREVALFKVRVPPRAGLDVSGENVHVVAAAGMGVGVVDDEVGASPLRNAMRGATSPTQVPWRAWLEAGQIASVSEWGLTFVREKRRWCADARDAGSLRLIESAVGEGDGTSSAPQATEPQLEELTPHEFVARGKRIVDALVRAGSDLRRDALRRALARAIARFDRRIEAVRGDLARMETAVMAAERARPFVARAARAPRGATSLEVVDWSSGEARQIHMAFDAARAPKEQIDALFKRARRLKEGSKIACARLAESQRARAALTAIVETLVATQDDGTHADPSGRDAHDVDIAALAARAHAAAPRDFRLDPGALPPQPSRARHAAQRPPHRTFVGASGARILVGRGAAHNDALTFHVSRPHDLWLHAKGSTGAHVVVPLDKGRSCPADLLVEAAHLAAHFSNARDESVVEVQYTSRRYLRKPRGSAPGLVVVDREKVMLLRREEETLRRLLEREVLG